MALAALIAPAAPLIRQWLQCMVAGRLHGNDVISTREIPNDVVSGNLQLHLSLSSFS